MSLSGGVTGDDDSDLELLRIRRQKQVEASQKANDKKEEELDAQERKDQNELMLMSADDETYYPKVKFIYMVVWFCFVFLCHVKTGISKTKCVFDQSCIFFFAANFMSVLEMKILGVII